MLNRRRFILGAPLDVIFIVVILYYTAGCARCKGERGENARNMSESADEEGHIAQKQMEIIGFLTKVGRTAESMAAGFERRKVEGGGRPAGQAATEGGSFGRRPEAAGPAGRIPGACRGLRRGKFRRGLPQKNCGEGNYA